MAISAARSTRGSSALAALVGVALAAAPSAAFAGDSALAESLFQEGKKLMAKKSFAEACPKLAESQRLDPGGGTLLTVALCHEAEGKTASAWSEYTEAAAIAKRDNRVDRERIANKHARALEPKLHQLSIVVTAKVPGFELKRDGTVIGEAAWTTPSPVDPGEHELSASAPGKKPWSGKIAVRDRETTVTVPPLEDAPAAAPDVPTRTGVAAATTPAPARLAHPRDDGWKTGGLVLAGAGVASIATGAFFGLRAASQSSEANDRCPQTQCSDRGAVDLQGDAQSNAILSTVLLGAGAAVFVGGGILFLAGGTTKRAGIGVSPSAGGASVIGRW